MKIEENDSRINSNFFIIVNLINNPYTNLIEMLKINEKNDRMVGEDKEGNAYVITISDYKKVLKRFLDISTSLEVGTIFFKVLMNLLSISSDHKVPT